MTLLTSLRTQDELMADVAAVSGQNIYACYQCGKCTASCPFSLNPQQVIRFLQLGQIERALTLDTPWACAGCLTCAVVCPKGLSPARINRALRTLPVGMLISSNHHPAGEDAAKKYKSLAPYYQAHGTSLRTRLFAGTHRLSPLGSALAPVSNWLLKLPGANLAAHHLLGIHKARSLPPYAQPTFPIWFRRHKPLGDGHRGAVLLFHDTFMDYNIPQVGIAATELLEKAGFRVELTDTVCCGRVMLSKGFLADAAAHARTNVARLYEHARKGVFIVGCEPSCLLTLRDEYPDLVGEPELKAQARVVAQQALLIDEFVAMLNAKGDLGLTFRPAKDGGQPVLFHAHCHQKALASPAKSVEVLRLAGYQAELVDAACCGMAGSYGYEKEHYDASRAAGERGLFPAVRARPDAELAVMGISCRQQLQHFVGRHPRHVAELLRDALA